MYKLLLVTDEQDLLDGFAAFEDWESLGFDIPRSVRTAKEAMVLIEAGTVDAVSFLLGKEEGQAFFTFLSQTPQVLCMEATCEPLRLRRALGRLRRSLHERSSVDILSDVLPLLQVEFFYSVLQGAPLTGEQLRARIQALQLSVPLEAPVCVAQLEMPQGETYLEEVWRYGRTRLEVALRNFFERDLPDMRYVLHVLSPKEIKLLACPKQAMDGEQLFAQTRAHIARACEDIEEFLEVGVRLSHISLYANLPALCAREAAIRVG